MASDNLSCLLYGPGKAKFEKRETPEIQDEHDVLIRIAYVGVCGSDVSSPSAPRKSSRTPDKMSRRSISGSTAA